MVERRSPKPNVGGSSPSWPAKSIARKSHPGDTKSMSVSTEQQAASNLDPLKWVIVVLLVGAAVAGNWYYASQPILYRVIAVVALVAMAGWVFTLTGPGKAFLGMLKDARIETRKIVWPSRKETNQVTGVVLLVVLIMSLILWLLDTGLGWVVSSLIG